MSCDPRPFEALRAGRLSGREARAARAHLAACSECAGQLAGIDRVELLAAVDPGIEPSADLAARFSARLAAHRAASGPARTPPYPSRWRRALAALALPRALAAAALAGCVAFGVYVGVQRRAASSLPPPSEMRIAENLPLLEDLGVIQNLDLLEDFDLIQSLPAAAGSTVQ
jgi:anti-sigma factor RsiW